MASDTDPTDDRTRESGRDGSEGRASGGWEAITVGDGWLSRPWLVIAKRELSSLRNEKTIIFALLVQLFIAAFSSSLVVGLTSMYAPTTTDANTVTIGVTGDATDELVAAAAEQNGVEVVSFANSAAARAAFNRGDIDAVLAGQLRRTNSGTTIDVVAIAPAETSRTSLVVVQLRAILTALERTERFERAANLEFQPVEMPESVPPAPYFEFTYTLLIPLLLFLPLFISGSVAVDIITEEIERGTIELLGVTPISFVDIIDGKAAGVVLLPPLQGALWILLLGVNGIAVGHPLTLLVFMTALGVIVITLGIIPALVTARRGEAQLLYSVFVVVLFGVTVVLPEHPATTVTKLAAESPTPGTFAHVVGFVALAGVLYGATRRVAGRLDPETLTERNETA